MVLFWTKWISGHNCLCAFIHCPLSLSGILIISANSCWQEKIWNLQLGVTPKYEVIHWYLHIKPGFVEWKSFVPSEGISVNRWERCFLSRGSLQREKCLDSHLVGSCLPLLKVISCFCFQPRTMEQAELQVMCLWGTADITTVPWCVALIHCEGEKKGTIFNCWRRALFFLLFS